MAILYHIKIEFGDPININEYGRTLFPPNIWHPDSPFYKRVIDNHAKNAVLYNLQSNHLDFCHIFSDEDELKTFCDQIAMTESEKLSMEEWKKLKNFKITYYTYNLSESTVNAPKILT